MIEQKSGISGPFEQQPYMNGLVVTIFGRVEPGSAQLEPLCTVGADIDENDPAANLRKADFILRACNAFDDLVAACAYQVAFAPLMEGGGYRVTDIRSDEVVWIPEHLTLQERHGQKGESACRHWIDVKQDAALAKARGEA